MSEHRRKLKEKCKEQLIQFGGLFEPRLDSSQVIHKIERSAKRTRTELDECPLFLTLDYLIRNDIEGLSVNEVSEFISDDTGVKAGTIRNILNTQKIKIKKRKYKAREAKSNRRAEDLNPSPVKKTVIEVPSTMEELELIIGEVSMTIKLKGKE